MTPPEATGGNSLPGVAQQTAAFGAPQNFQREQRGVALHFDIETVFERKRDHILRGKI